MISSHIPDPVFSLIPDQVVSVLDLLLTQDGNDLEYTASYVPLTRYQQLLELAMNHTEINLAFAQRAAYLFVAANMIVRGDVAVQSALNESDYPDDHLALNQGVLEQSNQKVLYFLALAALYQWELIEPSGMGETALAEYKRMFDDYETYLRTARC